MNEKIQALIADEDFKAKLSVLDTAEDIQKLFAENGVELSQEKIEEICAAAPAEGELDLDALDNVAGGAKIPWGPLGGVLIWKILKGTMIIC